MREEKRMLSVWADKTFGSSWLMEVLRGYQLWWTHACTHAHTHPHTQIQINTPDCHRLSWWLDLGMCLPSVKKWHCEETPAVDSGDTVMDPFPIFQENTPQYFISLYNNFISLF